MNRKILFLILISILLSLIYINNFYYKEIIVNINYTKLDFLNNKEIEHFQNFKISFNRKLSFLKNKDVDIICSGPSSKDVKINTNIIICSNGSILNKSVNNVKNNNKTIILILRQLYYQYLNITEIKSDSLIKKLLDKINVKVDYIFVKFKIVNNKGFNIMVDIIKKKFPKVIIYKMDYDKHSFSNNKYTPISVGMECINLAIYNNVSKIFISGIEMGIEKNYSYNNELQDNTNDKPKKARHIKADKKFIDKLSSKNFNKIISIKNSGLFEYLKNI